jgi:hypothetical protein
MFCCDDSRQSSVDVVFFELLSLALCRLSSSVFDANSCFFDFTLATTTTGCMLATTFCT